jgi:hypothetical protein
VSLERFEQDANGDLVYRFTRPWSDGTTGIKLAPLELLEKLAAHESVITRILRHRKLSRVVHRDFSEHNSFARSLQVGYSQPVASIRQGWEEKSEIPHSIQFGGRPISLIGWEQLNHWFCLIYAILGDVICHNDPQS